MDDDSGEYGKRGYRDESVFRHLHVEKGMSIMEISEFFDVSYNTTSKWAKRHGFETGHPDIETRFRNKYEVDDETGCWEWVAATDGDGYGVFTENGTYIRAHRYSHKENNSEIPEGGFVLHKCHNPPCVNPDHLYSGDNSDNMQDAIEAGRFPDTDQQRQKVSKLNEEEVVEIRNVYQNQDVPISDLADRFGVAFATVWDLLHGNTWADVEGPTIE